MCGIVGFWDRRGERPADRLTLDSMCARVRHRGPDGAGCYVRGALALGFRRLAIMDPANGDQPMFSEDGQVASICNGEFYNYRELRDQLERAGHVLRTRCDAELLPHLYEAYGIDLLDRLDGQFAFALYDGRRRQLYLARDPFGVNPLFYTTAGDTIIFGSEIKALLAHPAATRRIDLAGLDQVLTFPGLVSPQTMFEGVRSIGAGEYVKVTDSELTVRSYWDLDYPRSDDAATEEEDAGEDDRPYVEAVTAHLRRSVIARLQSDVPVGLYLSGGIDSSFVGALVRAAAGETPIESFSVVFDGSTSCESRFQQQVARALHCSHHPVRIDPEVVARRLPAAVYHAECPLRESYNTACLALSECARAHGVPVVLTGQGADELFAGYIGYRFDRFNASRPVAADADAVRERQLRARIWGDERLAYEGSLVAAEATKQRLYSDDVQAEYPRFSCLRTPPVPLDRLAGRSLLHKRAYLDFRLRLADHLLGDHGDRMAMAHGVEMRHPFLDRTLVDLVRTLPVGLQLRDLEEKYLIKQAARQWVPAEIIAREKFGWYAPGTPHLLRADDGAVRESLDAARIRRDGVFNPDTVRQLRQSYSRDGFVLNQPFEADLLMIVATFNLLVDAFDIQPTF